MRSYTLALLAGALCCAPGLAHAETLDFNFTGVNTEFCSIAGGSACDPQTISFQTPSNPGVLDSSGSQFEVAVTGAMFPSYLNGSGVIFAEDHMVVGTEDPGVPDFPGTGFYITSPFALFSGDPSAPTLQVGSGIATASLLSDSLDLNGTLTVSVATTPEPSTLLLLATGALAVLGVQQRRRLTCS